MPDQVIPIRDLGNAGVILDTPSVSLPPNVFSDARNVRFNDGAVRKIPGEVNLTSTDIAASGTQGTLRYLAYWPNPNRAPLGGYYVYVQDVIANNQIAGQRIFIQDETGARQDVTPTSMTNGFTSVTSRSETSWNHTLFAGGFAFIINNGVEAPHFILDPDGNTDITMVPRLAPLPNWNNYNIRPTVIDGVYNEATDTRVFDLGREVDFTNEEIIVQVNNGTPIEITSTGDANDITTATTNGVTTLEFDPPALMNGNPIRVTIRDTREINVSAGVIRAFGDFLVAGNLTETVRTNSSTVIRRLTGVVKTSDVAIAGAVPNNWDPFTAGVSTADEFILSDTATVQDMVELQGNLYIYTNSSIHSMSLTGNTAVPVRVSPVTDQYGVQSTNAVLEYDGKHFVIGSNDVYLFGGHPGNIQSIADARTRRYFYDNINPIHERRLFCLLNQAFDEIWICYPTLESLGGEADEALIWNYRDNTWSIRDLNSVEGGAVAPIPGGGTPNTNFTISNEAGGSVSYTTLIQSNGFGSPVTMTNAGLGTISNVNYVRFPFFTSDRQATGMNQPIVGTGNETLAALNPGDMFEYRGSTAGGTEDPNDPHNTGPNRFNRVYTIDFIDTDGNTIAVFATPSDNMPADNRDLFPGNAGTTSAGSLFAAGASTVSSGDARPLNAGRQEIQTITVPSGVEGVRSSGIPTAFSLAVEPQTFSFDAGDIEQIDVTFDSTMDGPGDLDEAPRGSGPNLREAVNTINFDNIVVDGDDNIQIDNTPQAIGAGNPAVIDLVHNAGLEAGGGRFQLNYSDTSVSPNNQNAIVEIGDIFSGGAAISVSGTGDTSDVGISGISVDVQDSTSNTPNQTLTNLRWVSGVGTRADSRSWTAAVVPAGITLVMADGTTYGPGTRLSSNTQDGFGGQITAAHVTEIFGVDGANLTLSGTYTNGSFSDRTPNPEIFRGTVAGIERTASWTDDGRIRGTSTNTATSPPSVGNLTPTITSSSLTGVTVRVVNRTIILTNGSNQTIANASLSTTDGGTSATSSSLAPAETLTIASYASTTALASVPWVFSGNTGAAVTTVTRTALLNNLSSYINADRTGALDDWTASVDGTNLILTSDVFGSRIFTSATFTGFAGMTTTIQSTGVNTDADFEENGLRFQRSGNQVTITNNRMGVNADVTNLRVTGQGDVSDTRTVEIAITNSGHGGAVGNAPTFGVARIPANRTYIVGGTAISGGTVLSRAQTGQLLGNLTDGNNNLNFSGIGPVRRQGAANDPGTSGFVEDGRGDGFAHRAYRVSSGTRGSFVDYRNENEQTFRDSDNFYFSPTLNNGNYFFQAYYPDVAGPVSLSFPSSLQVNNVVERIEDTQTTDLAAGQSVTLTFSGAITQINSYTGVIDVVNSAAAFSSSGNAVTTTNNVGGVSGLSVSVTNGDFTAREQVLLAPANNGGSITNPETATFDLTDGVHRVNWSGGTSSSDVGAYRVFTTTGGTAGTRVGGGSSSRFPNGYAGFDEGAYSGGVTFSATNIPNPIALPGGSTVGGVTTFAGGAPSLPTYISGTQENTDNSIRMAFVHGRGRNAAYQGEGASSFSQRFFLLSSGVEGARVIIFGPSVTYRRRTLTITNGNANSVTINSSIWNTADATLAGGATFTGGVLTLPNGGSATLVRQDQMNSWNVSGTYVAIAGASTTRTFGTDDFVRTVIGNGLYNVSEADSPAITFNVSINGVAENVLLERDLTDATDIRDDIYNKLRLISPWNGLDPSDATNAAENTSRNAQFFLSQEGTALRFTHINTGNQPDIDEMDFTWNTIHDGTTYGETQFGGFISDSITISNQGQTGDTPPTIRITHERHGNADIILFGSHTNPSVTDAIGTTLRNTGVWAYDDTTNVLSASDAPLSDAAEEDDNAVPTYDATNSADPSSHLPTTFALASTLRTRGAAPSTDSPIFTITPPMGEGGEFTHQITGTNTRTAAEVATELADAIQARSDVTQWTLPDPTDENMVFTDTERRDRTQIVGTRRPYSFVPGIWQIQLTSVGNTGTNTVGNSQFITDAIPADITASGIAVKFATPSAVVITFTGLPAGNNTRTINFGDTVTTTTAVIGTTNNDTIPVVSTAGFTATGTAVLGTNSGPVSFTYTGITDTSFTGVTITVTAGVFNGATVTQNSPVVGADDIADAIRNAISRDAVVGRRVTVGGTGGQITVTPNQFGENAVSISAIDESAFIRGTIGTTTINSDPAYDPPQVGTAPNIDFGSTTDLISYSNLGIEDDSIVTTLDLERPWANNEYNPNRLFPIFAQTEGVVNTATGALVLTNRIRAADVGFTFGGTPYNSYIERSTIGMTPEFDTEQLTSVALWASGGTQLVSGGDTQQATLRLSVRGTNSPGETTDLTDNSESNKLVVNDFTVGEDYKIDVRIHGRFVNYRLDDNDSPNNVAWDLSGIQLDVMKGGKR